VLDSTFFKFDQKIYKQNFGTPMGSPVTHHSASNHSGSGERGAGKVKL